MTDAELVEIEARAAQNRNMDRDDRDVGRMLATLKHSSLPGEHIIAESGLRATFQEQERLLQHAREDVPALIAEVRRRGLDLVCLRLMLHFLENCDDPKSAIATARQHLLKRSGG